LEKDELGVLFVVKYDHHLTRKYEKYTNQPQCREKVHSSEGVKL